MIKHLHKLCALVLVCCAFLGGRQVLGQDNPAAQSLPFSTDFSSMQNTTMLPNGVSAWYAAYFNSKSDAESSVPTDNAPITATASKQSSSSSIYNYTLNGNNRLYIQLTGSRANQIAAAVNTIGKSNISVAYDIELVNNQPRSVGATLQYRIGTSGAWTTVTGTDYSSIDKSEEGNVQSFNATLPSAAENQSIVQLRWITYEISTGASGARDGIALDNLSITDGANSVAPLTTSEAGLNFGSIEIGKSADVLNYTVKANNLAADLVLTTESPFSISKTADGNFMTSLSFTASEANAGASVFVKLNTAEVGAISGSIIHSSAGIANLDVVLSADVFSPFAQNFNNCVSSTNISGGWSQFSVTGDQTWACTTFGRDGNGVQMSGYSSGNKENVDWLISPKLDIANFTFPLLSIDYRTKYAGDALVIKVSTDYTGTGNPAAATWTTLTTLPADEADAWKTLEDLSLGGFKSENTYVAFVYTSTTEGATRWTLDNFELENEDNYLTTSNPVMYFAETAVGSATAPQQFTFKAEGYDANVVLTAPNNFELSKSGNDFTSSINYTPTEAANQNTVFVRFKPTSAVALAESSITFTSSDKLNTTAGKLIGSSILKAATLDVATWNLEWFGSSSNGPSDEQLQFDNAKRALSELNADIVAFQEITDESKARELAQELGYNYVSKKMDWQGSNDQVVAFMYNPQVATIKKEKVILSKLYQDIKAGATTLQGYPSGNSERLWASGRLPYLVQFEVSIGDTKQLYSLVNIHAKANSGDDMEQYDRRKYDVQVLKDSLDAQYADANVILLGDFNDDVDVSVVGTNNPSTYNMFVTDNKYVSLTYDLSLTGAATYESGSLKSFLDHQIISKSLEDEYIANSIRIESQLLENITNFRSTTSDHLPVTARFFISSDVTTGIAKATKGMFRVYPNPFMTHIRLELPARVAMLRAIALSVYSLEGRKLQEFKGTQEDVQQKLNNAIPKLNKGLYILKIQAGSEFFQTRMLKQ